MQCANPVYIHPVGEVPCGKCMMCRVSRSNEWGMRLMQEVGYWPASSFITLTYDNEHLPSDMGLHKDHLQKFFKRLRFDIKPRKVKYYACGEYGDRFKRPHYHAVMFGIGVKEVKLIREAWGFGFVHAGSVTYDSAKYVAGYVQKKYSNHRAAMEYGTRERPFQLQSQGLGKRFCMDNSNFLLRDVSMSVNGVVHSIPRYYRKVLGDSLTPEMLDRKREEREEELRKFCEERGISKEDSKKYLKEFRAQRKAELDTRIERWRDRNF